MKKLIFTTTMAALTFALAAIPAQATTIRWKFETEVLNNEYDNSIDKYLADRLNGYNPTIESTCYVIYDNPFWGSSRENTDAIRTALENGSFTSDMLSAYFIISTIMVSDIKQALVGANEFDTDFDIRTDMDNTAPPWEGYPYLYSISLLIFNGDNWYISYADYGEADMLDLHHFEVQYNPSPNFSWSTGVMLPEPATGILVLSGAAVVLLRRRRK